MDLIWAILPVAGAVLVPLAGLLFTPIGLPVLSWLIGNPVGRVVAMVGIVVMVIWLAFRIGRSDGVTRVKAQQKQRELQDLATKAEVLAEIGKLSADERRKRLRKWAR